MYDFATRKGWSGFRGLPDEAKGPESLLKTRPEAYVVRSLAACFLLGELHHAGTSLRLPRGERAGAPANPGVETPGRLAPSARRDPINGLTIDLKERDVAIVHEAMKGHLGCHLLASDAVRAEAVLRSQLGIKEVAGDVKAGKGRQAACEHPRRCPFMRCKPWNAGELGEAIPMPRWPKRTSSKPPPAS